METSRLAKIEKKKFKKEEQARFEEAQKKQRQYSILSKLPLDDLAKIAGFIKRQREITAFAFVYILSFSYFGHQDASFINLISVLQVDFNQYITASGLSQRINQNEAAGFLKSVFQNLVEMNLNRKIKKKRKIDISIWIFSLRLF